MELHAPVEDEDIEQDGLVGKMRRYADDTGNSATAVQRTTLLCLAYSLEQALSDPAWPVPKIVNCWAKARRYWCTLTGEPLV